MNTPTEMFVTFLDLLGFTALFIDPINGGKSRMQIVVDFYRELMSDIHKSMDAYMKIQKIAAGITKSTTPDMTVKIVSDSIIIAANNPIWMIVMIASAQKYILGKNLAVRGGIAHGLHWEETDKEKMLVVSPCFVDAYKLESKAVQARVIIDGQALRNMNLSVMATFGRQKMGMLVQSEDDRFAVNSMLEFEERIGTEEDQYFTIENIMRGMKNCTEDEQRKKWAWLADLYNFQALRIHGILTNEEWNKYYADPDATAGVLKEKADNLGSFVYCDYSELLLCRTNRFIDIQDLKRNADDKGIDIESLKGKSFIDNVKILKQ